MADERLLQQQATAQTLLSLPIEIRCLIWQHVFPPTYVRLDTRADPIPPPEDQGSSPVKLGYSSRGENLSLSLHLHFLPLSTCRHIYEEASVIAYNDLEICITGTGPCLSALPDSKTLPWPLLQDARRLQLHFDSGQQDRAEANNDLDLPNLSTLKNLELLVVSFACEGPILHRGDEAEFMATFWDTDYLPETFMKQYFPNTSQNCVPDSCQLLGLRKFNCCHTGGERTTSGLRFTVCVDLRSYRIVEQPERLLKMLDSGSAPFKTNTDDVYDDRESLVKAYQTYLRSPPYYPHLTPEDNRVINLRAAEMASTTQRGEMKAIVSKMSPAFCHSLRARGVEPIIYYFRMLATKEFRAKRISHPWLQPVREPK